MRIHRCITSLVLFVSLSVKAAQSESDWSRSISLPKSEKRELLFDGRTLSYIDLDIDVLIQPDLSYRVLDAEDFESNAARYRYSDDVRQKAAMALTDLTKLIEGRGFPFDQ